MTIGLIRSRQPQPQSPGLRLRVWGREISPCVKTFVYTKGSRMQRLVGLLVIAVVIVMLALAGNTVFRNATAGQHLVAVFRQCHRHHLRAARGGGTPEGEARRSAGQGR